MDEKKRISHSINAYKKKIQYLSHVIKTYESKIEKYRNSLAKLKENLDEFYQKENTFRQMLAQRDEVVNQYKAKKMELEEELQLTNKVLSEYKEREAEKNAIIHRLQEQEREWKRELEQKEQMVKQLKSLENIVKQNEWIKQNRAIQSEQDGIQADLDQNQMADDSSWIQMYQNWSQGHETKGDSNEIEAAVSKDQRKNPPTADSSLSKKQFHLPPEFQVDPNQITKFLRQHQTPYENHFLERFKKK